MLNQLTTKTCLIMEKARQSNVPYSDIFKVTAMFEDSLCAQYAANKTSFSELKIIGHFRNVYFRSDYFY